MNDASGGRADQLTRTTLTIDGGMAQPAVVQVMHALRRVPGVLLAEIDAAAARAVVAHDSGVPPASLVAAAAGAGVRATIVLAARAVVPNTHERVSLRDERGTRILFFGIAVCLTLTVIEIAVPNGAGRALAAAICALWAIFFLRALFQQRG